MIIRDKIVRFSIEYPKLITILMIAVTLILGSLIAGVKVGRVSEIRLDDTLRARVVVDLNPNLQLPVDTSAAIRTQGLLGDNFVSLEPGAEDDLLVSGEEISFTDSALNLESLIGTLVHSVDFEDDEE